ncbi:MAG TPA: tetratricopeptide repeat protein [Methylomirabilota bacterium]|nr:tetratricopeptide repeat protein [Methylomirabilota bacterium]
MRWLLGLAAATLLAACQQGPATHPPVTKTLSPAEQLKVDGDAFMAKGDYVNAVEKYRQAVDLEPAAIAPRFALGTAFSFLDERAEAIVQFRWVLSRADASSTEYREARRWLVSVGALVVPVAAVDAPQREQERPVDSSLVGRLVGKTEWPDITPQRRLITGTLSLVGDEPVTQDVKRSRAFRLGDGYEFKDIPAGRYRVVAVVDGTTLWDEKVTVEAGKDTSFTLSQSTSPVPASKFAPAPTKAAAEDTGAAPRSP